MSSSCTTITTLEELPDELLLLICRYLSSIDVLCSFYGLNFRLTQTISGYCQHVVLAQVPFARFNYTCTSILPDIGTNICSLVVSDRWKGVLSKLFTNYFGDRMSSIFPNLKQLTFISFTDNSLKPFLDSLQNLPELHEIIICGLYQITTSPIESERLLDIIFTANNNRLNSIFLDDDSMFFSLEDKYRDIIYSNIQKLSINLQTINDLHRLLTLLPQLISINVAVNTDIDESDKIHENISIVTLKQFQLQSFGLLWNLDDLASILKRIPNVEELSIAIKVNHDTRLIDGESVFPLVSALSLRKFNYFIRFYDSSPSIDNTKILLTWQQFKQEFVCVKSDDKKMLVLYTLPFVFSFLILPSSIAKNEVFIESYAPQVKNLTLYDASTVDIFSVIKKCHRIQNLNLRIDGNIAPKLSKEIDLCKLPYLTKITALRESPINTDCFQRLIEILPNLHHLEVNYEFLRPLLDIESVCLLLKHRITHIYILITTSNNLESIISSISRLPSIFPSLKHSYFYLEKFSQSSELLISVFFKYLSEWNCLVSFGVVGAGLKQELFSKDLQQWVLENSTLCEHNSFAVDYTDDVFRLWL